MELKMVAPYVRSVRHGDMFLIIDRDPRKQFDWYTLYGKKSEFPIFSLSLEKVPLCMTPYIPKTSA